MIICNNLEELFTEHLENLYINGYMKYKDVLNWQDNDDLYEQYEEFVEDYLQCLKDSYTK